MEAGEDPLALEAFERAVACDASLYSAWHWIGILRKRPADGDAAQLELALEAFRKALATGAPRSREMNEIAVTLARLGRMEEALDTWREALGEDPDWGVLHANAIKAAISLRRVDVAEEVFRQSLKASRFEPNGALIWGNFLLDKGQEKEAVLAFRLAVDAAPDDPRLRYAYGMALEERGDEDEAGEQLARAVRLAREQDDLGTMLAADRSLFTLRFPKDHKRLVQAEELMQDAARKPRDNEKILQKVIRTVDPVIEDHPDRWEGLLMRGMAWRLRGQSDLALKDFEAVIRIAPGQPNALINMALIHRDGGELKLAADYADQALARGTEDPFVRLNAAFVFIDAGDCDRARAIRDGLREALRGANLDSDPLAPLETELETRCP